MPKTIIHCSTVSGVDNHMRQASALCDGKLTKGLAPAGSYDKVTCPECRAFLQLLHGIDNWSRAPKLSNVIGQS